VTSLDYILLAADNAHVMEGVTTMLRGAGAAVERHDLGLRMSARGANWKSALGHLSDGLAGFARRGVRVALIPIGADTLVFQKALLTSQPLETFAQTLDRPAACAPVAATASADNHFLGVSSRASRWSRPLSDESRGNRARRPS
jgi:hypothetical protein